MSVLGLLNINHHSAETNSENQLNLVVFMFVGKRQTADLIIPHAWFMDE